MVNSRKGRVQNNTEPGVSAVGRAHASPSQRRNIGRKDVPEISFFTRPIHGMFLAVRPAMGCLISTCDRCGEQFVGNSYRVTSESQGKTLLDMVVCYGCYLEASQLGLDTGTIKMSEALSGTEPAERHPQIRQH